MITEVLSYFLSTLTKMFMHINKATPCKTDAYKGLSLISVLEAGLEPARRLNAKGF